MAIIGPVSVDQLVRAVTPGGDRWPGAPVLHRDQVRLVDVPFRPIGLIDDDLILPAGAARLDGVVVVVGAEITVGPRRRG